MSQAATKFNFKPKNGINYLVANNLICSAQDWDRHVKEIVIWLKTNPLLDKTKIGEFMGADDKLQKACLYRFIDEFDLKGVDYIKALKTIL
jgi:brefeldin A-inhibited guanine nucleotide-exchange protein